MKLKKQYCRHSTSSRLYQCPIPIIGLTGGVASGKSTVAKLLRQQQLPLICADSLVKEIYQQDFIRNFVEQQYPQAITANEINFKKLREIAFSSPEERQKLETIIYQRLPEAFLSKLSPEFNFVVYDVPLLFEKKLETQIDFTICVYTHPSLQRTRLMARDQISCELAQKIIDAQMAIDEKKEKADFIIDNTETLEPLAAQITALCASLFDT